MESESGGMSPITRIVAGIVVVGVILTTFLPLVSIFRNTSDTENVAVDSQLGKVPVFTVTDETGRPFLSETEDHQLRRGYFFIHPADAQKYLERVQEDGSSGKVLTIGLDEAIKFLEKSGPAKSIPERFELFPDVHESEIARTVTGGAFQNAFGSSAVPIFYIDGLGIKESNEGPVVFPLFFEKEKLDEALTNLKNTDPTASLGENDLQVVDLRQTVKELRAGANPRLKRVIFVPVSDALKAMRRTQTDQ